MALRRWRWVWGPVVAAALLAALLLPGGEPRGGLFLWLWEPAWGPRGNLTFRDDVQRAVNTQHTRLRMARLSDSLTAASHGPRSLHSPDGTVAVVYQAPIAADTARLWLKAAMAELAHLPAALPGGTPIVIALMAQPLRSGVREFDFSWWGARRILPTPQRRACIIGFNLNRPGSSGSGSTAQGPKWPVLGMCSLYHVFGIPGPDTRRWLNRVRWDDQRGVVASAAPQPERRREIPRPGFVQPAQWSYWYSGVPWIQIACLRGERSVCERYAVEGAPTYWWSYSDLQGSELVLYLLANGTPTQFASFWRSGLPVREALRQAYGQPAGELAYRAYTQWYYAQPGGPRARPRLLLAGLVWAGAALALAVVAGRRWTTEI